ncbi:uncharacterized protein [Sinocyclocheilus grahami]|uniref:uncharacterized protein n=1 Tax=Sinocyclocheilus grahami TaxID=75366 RepID=UPI0007AC9AB2|nr:PREDICTED: uncharacterized protein LOC107566464 [Sinocyclocheilus grahami]
MAYGTIRERLILILSSFTCITLVQCRHVLQLSENEKANDDGEFISEQHMFDHDEALPDFEYLGDDAIVSGQVSSSEAAWYAMSPSLRCGDDLMKLQLSGPEVAQVELCRGNGAPVTLNELPLHCGHTIPTYGGLIYATPYDGCGVAQQGGSYVMQMQWQGNGAVISCPMTSTTANETFIGPHSLSYQQILLPPLFSDKVTTITMTELSATLKPLPYGYPQVFPQEFWPYYYPRYHYPGKGYPTAEPAGKPPSDAQVPTQKPQFPKHPHMMWPYPYSHYPGKGYPTAEPVEESSTDAQVPTQKPQFPKHPHMMWPYPYSHYPGKGYPTAEPAEESSTDVQAPNQNPQFPKHPHMMWPYYYPDYHGKPTPTLKPAPAIPTSPPPDSPAISQKPQPTVYPLYLQQFYPQYPVQPPKSPTASPITTTPQPCTITAAAECQPLANQPLKEPPQYYKPPIYTSYEKEPFALKFVCFSELDPKSFP